MTFIALTATIAPLRAQVDEVGNTIFTMDVDGNNLKIPYYVSKPLDEVNNEVNLLVISQHGTNRNASVYRTSMFAAANQANQKDRALILAPQFLREIDINTYNLPDDYLFWSNDGWKVGHLSQNTTGNPRPARISSYDVMDRLITSILNSGNFPNIDKIVVAGFSAGGQYVNRYAASNLIHDQVKQTYDIEMEYMVGGPSSYIYFNDERKIEGTTDQFEVPATTCAEFNDYKYGLNEINTYLSITGPQAITEQYKTRKILYAVGSLDNDPDGNALDKDCPALLQGDHRLERGTVYFNYLKHFYGVEIEEFQSFVEVPDIGHSHSPLFSSDPVRTWIFSRRSTTTSVEEFNTGITGLKVYPNPTTSTAQLTYFVPATNMVSLKVLDLQGRYRIELLNSVQSAGFHTFDWKADGMSNGLYILQLQIKNQLTTFPLIINR